MKIREFKTFEEELYSKYDSGLINDVEYYGLIYEKTKEILQERIQEHESSINQIDLYL